MSPEVATFLFELGNFALLAFGLGWFFFRPMKAALDDERRSHEERNEEVARREAGIEARDASLHQKLEGLEEELRDREERALASTREKTEQLVATATQEAQIRRRSEDEASRRRVHAELDELTELIGQVAGRSVERLMRRVGGPEVADALTRLACEELSRLALDDGARPLVTSAAPLSEVSRAALVDVMGASFEELVDPGLGVGLRIETRSGVVDATARSFASSATREVIEGLGANVD